MQKTNFYFLSILIFSQLILNAQITFKKQFQTPFPTNASTVQQTYDHGYIIMAIEDGHYGIHNMFLIKTNETGDTLWSKVYSNGAYGYLPQGMVQCPDSGVAVIGVKNGVYLLRLTKNGDSLWGKELGSGTPYAIEISLHNEFIISGSDTTLLFIRANYNGDLLIHKNISILPPGYLTTQMGFSIKPTNDNGSIIGGTSDWGYSLAFLAKTDYYGNKQWAKEFPFLYWSRCHSIDITKDSGFVLAGSFINQSYDAFCLKTNFVGDTLWVNKYTGPRDQTYRSVITSNDGDYIACGSTADSLTGIQHILLTKTIQSGSLIWSRNLYSAKELYGVCVKQTYDGGFVILGDIQENDSSSY